MFTNLQKAFIKVAYNLREMGKNVWICKEQSDKSGFILASSNLVQARIRISSSYMDKIAYMEFYNKLLDYDGERTTRQFILYAEL